MIGPWSPLVVAAAIPPPPSTIYLLTPTGWIPLVKELL